MNRYCVEFSFEPDDDEPLYLYVMAYSEQHVKDIFPDYFQLLTPNIVAINQTD